MKQQEIIDNMREHCTNLALCEKFSNVCNELAERINHRLFEDSREFHWILDTPGGLCDFEDTDFLAPYEMVLILEYNISYDQYAEWREANLTHTHHQPPLMAHGSPPRNAEKRPRPPKTPLPITTSARKQPHKEAQ